MHRVLFFYLVHWDAIFRGNSSEKFRLHTELNPNVGVLRLFPGITDTTVSILDFSCNACDFSWKALSRLHSQYTISRTLRNKKIRVNMSRLDYLQG